MRQDLYLPQQLGTPISLYPYSLYVLSPLCTLGLQWCDTCCFYLPSISSSSLGELPSSALLLYRFGKGLTTLSSAWPTVWPSQSPRYCDWFQEEHVTSVIIKVSFGTSAIQTGKWLSLVAILAAAVDMVQLKESPLRRKQSREGRENPMP